MNELEQIRAQLHAIHTNVGVLLAQVNRMLEPAEAPKKKPPRTFGQPRPEKDDG